MRARLGVACGAVTLRLSGSKRRAHERPGADTAPACAAAPASAIASASASAIAAAAAAASAAASSTPRPTPRSRRAAAKTPLSAAPTRRGGMGAKRGTGTQSGSRSLSTSPYAMSASKPRAGLATPCRSAPLSARNTPGRATPGTPASMSARSTPASMSSQRSGCRQESHRP